LERYFRVTDNEGFFILVLMVIGKKIRYFRLPVVLSLIGLLSFCAAPIAMAQSEAPIAAGKPAADQWDREQKESRPNMTRSNLEKQSNGRLVSIDFHDMDINLFIKFISDFTGKNFVIDEDVKGKVTVVSPGKVTPREAYKVFESVLEVHGFSAVPSGKITKIVSLRSAGAKSVRTRLKQEAESIGDTVVTQLIPLRYADPAIIAKLIAPMASEGSSILPYPPTNTLFITDASSNVNRLLRIIKEIDKPGVGRKVVVIPIKYASAARLVSMLKSMFKDQKEQKADTVPTSASFVADEIANTIMVLGSKSEIPRIRKLVQIMDEQAAEGQERMHVYYLKHASAEQICPIIKKIPQKIHSGKVSSGVDITCDPATNSLLITSSMEDYLAIEKLIAKVDIPRAMVYIEALIMEVNTNKDFRLGMEWIAGNKTGVHGDTNAVYGGGFGGGTLGGEQGYNYTGATKPNNGGQTSILPPGFSLGIFGEALSISGIKFPSISAVIQAYKKDTDIRILSTPQILTTDNQEATIHVGRNIPFQTNVSNVGDDVFNSFEYRDIGKTLKITPQVSSSSMLRLELSLAVTQLETSVLFRPTTLKRTINTTILVKDRHTVVLGGLIDDQVSEIKSKVPCLGDVPGLRALFKSSGLFNDETNLFVFLTPRIVDKPESADDLSDEKRARLDRTDKKSEMQEVKFYKDEPQDNNQAAPVIQQFDSSMEREIIGDTKPSRHKQPTTIQPRIEKHKPNQGGIK
jgi:general secretion pathway protein D